jgi:hypothetical protein
MNAATPIPIMEGDYVLVDMNLSPSLQDIVVAMVLDPTSIEERAGIVKRLTNRGLVSVSTEKNKEYAFEEVDIKGVVIAVAKPNETIESQKQPDGSSLYLSATPLPEVFQSAYAVSNIRELNKNNFLHLWGKYHLEAGIIVNTVTSEMEDALTTRWPKDTTFDILVHAEGMELEPSWHQAFSFYANGSNNLIEFTLIPKELGKKDIQVEFFYKRHWLTRIKHTVEVIE